MVSILCLSIPLQLLQFWQCLATCTTGMRLPLLHVTLNARASRHLVMAFFKASQGSAAAM